VEQVRKTREHAPFKPFTLFLSDQRKFEIHHPGFLWVIPGGRSIAIADGNGVAEIIDLLHVTSLKTNGAAKS
jgi:hypothetical protein